MKLDNKFKKVILITLVLFLIMFVDNVILASSTDLQTDKFKPNAEEVPDEVINVGGTIYNALTTLGIIISVISLIAIGIKYMLGSVEEKAEYKKVMIPYVIGAVLVGAGSVIVIAIQEMVGWFYE